MVTINNQPFGAELFDNKEAIYLDVELKKDCNSIEVKFEDNGDIASLLLATEYIKDEAPESKIKVNFKYLPYSGMDRKINNQVFSLKLLAQLLNKQHYEAVEVLDAHNMKVTSELIERVHYTDINYYIGQAIDDFKPDVIYFPDKGAKEKYPSLVDTRGLPIIYGNKVRDLKNKGHILSYETITNGVGIEGKRVLIVDDICRKGGTFIWAAQELGKLNVGKIALHISHCETGIIEGNVLDDDSPLAMVYINDSEPAVLKLLSLKENADKALKVRVLE